MTDSQKTPTIPPPSTDPRGLPLHGSDEPGVRDLILAFRDDWQQWKAQNAEQLASVVSGLRTLDGRQTVIESDYRQLRSDVLAARAASDAARTRADDAHAMAQAANFAAGRVSIDSEAERETLLSALSSTRGELRAASAAIGTLTKTDDDLKVMIAKAAKDSAGAAIRDVVGKNPKLVAGVGAVLLVVAQVLTQRFLIPPAAPNQGALPTTTPTVHVLRAHFPHDDGGP